uniref:Uncharacterized protein n=1 Tax=Leersia perrieri TaxID=77586 RepID=A0A0D9WYL2_9ORYZ
MPPPPPEEERRTPSLAESREWTERFLRHLGMEGELPASLERPDAYSALVRGILSSASVVASSQGLPRVSCTLTVSPASIVSPPVSSDPSPAESFPLPTRSP